MLDSFESIPFSLQPGGDSVSMYRSAAVARMLCMPVSTLRIWERRYRVTAPTTTPSGHRLYSAADVQRLALLKQLTGVGHAIGSIAKLDMAGLRRVAATHMQSMNIAQPVADEAVAWPVAVVGDGLVQRLQRPELVRQLGRRMDVVISFGSIDEAAHAVCIQPVKMLLVQAAGLHLKWLPELQKAIDMLGVRYVLVCYGYGTISAVNAFEAAGVLLLRSVLLDRELAPALSSIATRVFMEPSSDGQVLAESSLSGNFQQSEILSSTDATQFQKPAANAHSSFAALLHSEPPAPSRYHPATLVEMANLSTALSCECPGHVAQLLTLLTEFETYSAECVQLSRSDADVHLYLQYTAGKARELFEAALERLALHEGIMLSA